MTQNQSNAAPNQQPTTDSFLKLTWTRMLDWLGSVLNIVAFAATFFLFLWIAGQISVNRINNEQDIPKVLLVILFLVLVVYFIIYRLFKLFKPIILVALLIGCICSMVWVGHWIVQECHSTSGGQAKIEHNFHFNWTNLINPSINRKIDSLVSTISSLNQKVDSLQLKIDSVYKRKQ